MRYIEPPAEYLERYQELYTQIDQSNGMRITDIQHAIGAVSAGSAVRAIAALETLGLLLWYEPESKKYKVVKYEDELMEVVR